MYKAVLTKLCFQQILIGEPPSWSTSRVIYYRPCRKHSLGTILLRVSADFPDRGKKLVALAWSWRCCTGYFLPGDMLIARNIPQIHWRNIICFQLKWKGDLIISNWSGLNGEYGEARWKGREIAPSSEKGRLGRCSSK